MSNIFSVDLEFQESDSILEYLPNIVIKYLIKGKNNTIQISDNEYLKILYIECKMEIYLKDVENRIKWKYRLPDLYTYRSYFSKMQNLHISEELLIELPNSVMEKIVEGHFLQYSFGLKVNTYIKYEKYVHIDSTFVLTNPDGILNSFIHDKHNENDIIFNKDQIEKVLRNNKINNKLRVEIPLSLEGFNNDLLSKAITNLKLAKESYLEGRLEGFLINSRNAIISITEFENPSSSNSQRILSKKIKDFCMSNIPDDDKDSYKDIFRHFGNMVLSLLRILHKFVHEDQDKVRRWPIGTDLEFIYLETSILLRYLINVGTYHGIKN